MFTQPKLALALASTAIAIVGALGFYLMKKQKKRVVIPKNWTPVGKVSNLYLYPLKSGHRLPLNRAECTDVGLRVCEEDEKSYQLRDREFIVYGEGNNEFKTARTFPHMVRIQVSVHDKKYITFDAPDMRQLFVQVPSETQPQIKINMRGEVIPGYDCGDEAAEWLSRYISNKEKGLRLALYKADSRRKMRYSEEMEVFTNLSNESMGMFSDLSSILLINEASISDLNDHLDSKVSHDYFRPNIVVEGLELAAFAEESWDFIKIGEVVFRNVKTCTRCIFTTINPENGVRNKNREPLKTLEEYHKVTTTLKGDGSPSPAMGVNLQTLTHGVISLNDTIYFGKN